MPTVSLHTLGCKLNQAETEGIGRQFLERGFALAESGASADVWVINTCSVTARADRECRQLIRRALRSAGNPFVIVTGCYAQLQPEAIASIRGVDLVLGAREKFRVFDYLGSLEKYPCPGVFVSAIDTVDNFGPGFSTEAGNRTRAYLKVQDGCDYTCSFCTIPLARGSSRSQAIDACVGQARELVNRGYKEIVLTGVNVGDYGRKTGTSLIELLRALLDIDGIERLRVSSIEPNLLSDEIIDLAASSETLCKHFHIPLQSGDDAVLRRMRRRYTTGDYARLVDRILRRIPDCGIGVDVIVGFPGESEESFLTTYRFLNELPVSYLHVFTYSERTNTPASHFPDTVEPKIRFRRSDMLRILSQKKRRAYYGSAIGKTVVVLTEGEADEGLRYGLTNNYIRVSVPAERTSENNLVSVRVTGIVDDVCVGEVVVPEAA